MATDQDDEQFDDAFLSDSPQDEQKQNDFCPLEQEGQVTEDETLYSNEENEMRSDDSSDDSSIESIRAHADNAAGDFASTANRMPAVPKSLSFAARTLTALGHMLVPECMTKPDGKRKAKDVHSKCRDFVAKESAARSDKLQSLQESFLSKENEWVACHGKLNEEIRRLSACLDHSNSTGNELRNNIKRLMTKIDSAEEKYKAAAKQSKDKFDDSIEKMSGEHKSELTKRDKTEEKLKNKNDDLKRSNELLQEKFKEQLDKTKKQKTTINRLETELYCVFIVR
eukprot:scaffold85386_cov38-Cyclotella_meneghiniana.AAC.3